MELGRLRSILLGSKIRVAVAVLGVLVTVAGVGVATGLIGAPAVAGVENRFADVDETTTTIESDLTVTNPNPVGVRFGGLSVDYAVTLNGITMATGVKEGADIETGNSTLHFSSRLRNERIPDWWVSHLQNGEQSTLTVDADVHSSLVGGSFGAPAVERPVETDVSSAFNSTETRPIGANQPLVSDPVLYLNETSGHWGEVNETTTPIEMTFTLYNPNPYPISASSIGYDVTMNDLAVGSGATDRSVTIPPGETESIDARTIIRTQRLDDWWVTHLERNQVTELDIRFYARFDLSAAGGGTVRVPLDGVNHTIETDVFGTKNATATGSENGSDGTGTDGSESTPTGSATTTATDTAGDPTETTDDGGLLSGDEGTSTDTQTETTSDETASETPASTPTDDGGNGDETATDDGVIPV